MYHLAITAAERSIDLSVAYFVPDELTQKHLLGITLVPTIITS